MSAYPQDLKDRFLRYVQIDTQSDEDFPTVPTKPSTDKQYDLLNLLVSELNVMGAADVTLTDYGCVLATIPATVAHKVPTIALLAHVDTAPAYSGTDVKPIVHEKYDGQPIVLPDDPSKIIDPEQFPYLATKQGEDVITASGLTLLGADDKAGVAVCMSLAKHLLANKSIPHGDIRLCFTPDEEIGHGVTNLTIEDLAADYAYTLDGGAAGEIEYETFSADGATVVIEGVSIHPGTANGKLVNALLLANKFIDMLPQNRLVPELTSGREGFIFLHNIQGSAAKAELRMIVRDFEMEGLEANGRLVQQAADHLQTMEPRATVTCTIEKQYRNMRYWLENDMRPAELAMKVIKASGIEPISTPIRGGTDGSRLTEKGVLCPNLFTGMQNLHGPLEYVSLQDMGRSLTVCVELVQAWGKDKA